MSPFWKQASLLRRGLGILGEQSVHPAPEKSRLLDGGAKEEEKENAVEKEEKAAEFINSRRGGTGVRAMLKKLLSIGGREKKARKKGAHLAVYIGEELQRFDVPIEYFRHEGFAKLLLECRDADALDFNINLPIEIESCSVERFHRVWRGAVEEENALRRLRWRL